MSLTRIELCHYVRDLCAEMAKLSDKLELVALAHLFRMTELEARTFALQLEAVASPPKRRIKPAISKRPKKLAA